MFNSECNLANALARSGYSTAAFAGAIVGSAIGGMALGLLISLIVSKTRKSGTLIYPSFQHLTPRKLDVHIHGDYYGPNIIVPQNNRRLREIKEPGDWD